MKIYILCVESGARYPYGFNGGDYAFSSEIEAMAAKKAIEQYDSRYCIEKGGLHIESLEGSETMLKAIGFRWE